MASDYIELPGSPTEAWDHQGLKATRMVSCPWEDRYEVFVRLISYTESMYPYIAGGGGAYVRSVAIQPLKNEPCLPATPGDFTLAKYDYAKISLTYDTVQGETRDPEDDENNPDGITLFEEDLEANFEVIWLEPELFVYGEEDPMSAAFDAKRKLLYMDAPSYHNHGMSWRITYYGVNKVPSWVFDLMGKINSDAVVSPTLGVTFEPYTLRYTPPSLSRTLATDEAFLWTISVGLDWRPVSWNLKYCPDWEARNYEDGPWINTYVIGDVNPYEFYEPVSFEDAGILPPVPATP